MFVRRNNARVWIHSDFDAASATQHHQPLHGRKQQGPDGQPRVIHAQRPTVGKLGRCLSIRLKGTELEVLVANPERATRWYPAAQALTERQAEAWAEFGFAR